MRRVAMLIILVLLSATSASPTQKRRAVRVYFTNDKLNPGMIDCGKVFPVTRKVPTTASVARAALKQLFRGPTAKETAKGYISTFSERTKSILISVKVKNGTAYVNLKDFRPIIPNTSASCASALFLAEMDATLKQFRAIKRTVYAIEGIPSDFYGHLQMDCADDPKLCDEAPFK